METNARQSRRKGQVKLGAEQCAVELHEQKAKGQSVSLNILVGSILNQYYQGLLIGHNNV